MKYEMHGDVPPTELDLRNFFSGEEELVVVLKGHLLVEHYLGLLLAMPQGGDEAKRRVFEELGFFQKCVRAIDAGIVSSDERDMLLKVNSIRNNFAHNPRAYLSDDVANELWRTLSKRTRERISAAQRFGPEDFDLALDLFKCVVASICLNLDDQLRAEADHS